MQITTPDALSIEGAFAFHAQSDRSTWSDALQDGLGSVRGGVGSGVDAVQHYDPYGSYIGTAASDAYFGFTGEMTDTNRQVYLRARYYDPSLGVFPSLDPYEGTMDRPMSMNGYSWVEGNTPNLVDPSGMQTTTSEACMPKPKASRKRYAAA